MFNASFTNHVNLRLMVAFSMTLLNVGTCFSEASEQSYRYHYTVDTKAQTPEEVGNFLKNLPKYYLKLSEGHRKFKVLNGDYLEQGAIIDNEEVVGGQTVKHKYVVDSVIDNAYYKLVSNPSRVTGLGIFSVDVKTTVEFIVSQNEQGHTLFKSVLTIEFKDGVSKFFADFIGTEEIWGRHLKEEMDNGAKVINSKRHYDW